MTPLTCCVFLCSGIYRNKSLNLKMSNSKLPVFCQNSSANRYAKLTGCFWFNVNINCVEIANYQSAMMSCIHSALRVTKRKLLCALYLDSYVYIVGSGHLFAIHIVKCIFRIWWTLQNPYCVRPSRFHNRHRIGTADCCSSWRYVLL